MIESTITNTCHAVGNSDGGQTRAVGESIIANICHTIGDGDRGKARTAIEGKFANTRYTIRNNNVCDFGIIVTIKMMSACNQRMHLCQYSSRYWGW